MNMKKAITSLMLVGLIAGIGFMTNGCSREGAQEMEEQEAVITETDVEATFDQGVEEAEEIAVETTQGLTEEAVTETVTEAETTPSEVPAVSPSEGQ